MPTPERQQDPGSQGYGGANQDDPGADKERDETPQERVDQETAEQRRLVEAQSEAEAEPVEVQAPPTDESPLRQTTMRRWRAAAALRSNAFRNSGRRSSLGSATIVQTNRSV
jgi:hypothetical protein